MSLAEFKREASIESVINRFDTENEIDAKIDSIWTSIKHRAEVGENFKGTVIKYASNIDGSFVANILT